MLEFSFGFILILEVDFEYIVWAVDSQRGNGNRCIEGKTFAPRRCIWTKLNWSESNLHWTKSNLNPMYRIKHCKKELFETWKLACVLCALHWIISVRSRARECVCEKESPLSNTHSHVLCMAVVFFLSSANVLLLVVCLLLFVSFGWLTGWL